MLNMNRRTLLYTFGLASVAPLLPAAATDKAKVAVANPGESRFPFSTAQQAKLSPCKLTADDTAGTLSAFELSALPQTGPYLHVHHREDEWYYVLSGDFIFKAGGEEHHMATGASIWLPRGIPHVWANTSTVEAKLILICQPGGFEKFFEEIGKESDTPLDAETAMKKMKATMAMYGIEMLGPPLLGPLRPQVH
jgi:mannose-6-phosphate isomerase-like protein (cupin superfamily)